MKSNSNAFKNMPYSIRNSFLLNFFAAIYFLINHIRRLGDYGGENLEDILKKYPFLGSYFTEMLTFMPDRISWEDGLVWWESEIKAWEGAAKIHLPLQIITENLNLSFENRLAFMFIGLVEEDSRFGTLFSKLQEPLAYRRPCLELAGQVVLIQADRRDKDSWTIIEPIILSGLIDVANTDAPRSEWVVRVPSLLWDIVRGKFDSYQFSWCHYHPCDNFPFVNDLIFPDSFVRQLEQVPVLIKDGKANALVLRGTEGSDRHHVMGALARSLGFNMVEVDHTQLSHNGDWRLIGPFCAMTRSLPVITYNSEPGDTEDVPSLSGYKGPLGIIIGLEGGLKGKAIERTVTLTLPVLKSDYRMRYWQKALNGQRVENLNYISERFHIPGGHIRRVASMAIAHAALQQREIITGNDVLNASRMLNRQLLDTLATPLESKGSWDRLVVNTTTFTKLKELEHRCCHRESVSQNLGPAFGKDHNRGVRALFTGISGTGKTLAAKILAAVLGMDIYRVDLAAVINKYIGETEKNLHRILSRAEELDVVLLLDEGDALLGNRTEVKSANDRYANLETNYLLQKLENYQGILIVTTNAGQYIDSAFQRRMDVVVNFLAPQTSERLLIWQLHLSENHDVNPNYLEKIAYQCPMTGGQIRNAAIHAALLALNDGNDTIKDWHLEEAVLSEYRKAGAICPLSSNGGHEKKNQGMEDFIQVLSL